MAIQQVRTRIARDPVGQRIAPALQISSALQLQVLHVLRQQRNRHQAAHHVRSLAGAFLDHVIQLVDNEGVVACTAGHRVDARAPVEQVVARTAEQRVVAHATGQRVVARIACQFVGLRVARHRQVRHALQHHLPHLRVPRRRRGQRQPQVQRHATPHLKIAIRVDDAVQRRVDHVGVRARTAFQRVGATAPIEQVISLATDDRVRARVAAQHVRPVRARERERPRAQQLRILDVREHARAQHQAAARDHHVAAILRRLPLDHVTQPVQHVGVVTTTARQRVRPHAPVEPVPEPVALDPVRQRIARAVDRSPTTQQHQPLHVQPQHVAHQRAHLVHPAGHPSQHLLHQVPGCIDYIGVVTRATNQRVVACVAIQQVRTRIARDPVGQPVAPAVEITRARQLEVLHVIGQHDRPGTSDQVGSPVLAFHHCVPGQRGRILAGDAQHVGVIARPAGQQVALDRLPVQQVVAGPPHERVRAAAAAQSVVERVAGKDVRRGRAGDDDRTRQTCEVGCLQGSERERQAADVEARHRIVEVQPGDAAVEKRRRRREVERAGQPDRPGAGRDDQPDRRG